MTTRRKNTPTCEDGLRAKGFFRLHIHEDGDPNGPVVGDTGWRENQIQNLGYASYLVGNLIGASSLGSINAIGIGTGGLANVTDVTLAGEVLKRATGTNFSIATPATNSKTAIFYGSFNTNQSFLTGAGSTISNIGLFNSTATGAGQMFANNTYTGSACASNQAVTVTYQITFT